MSLSVLPLTLHPSRLVVCLEAICRCPVLVYFKLCCLCSPSFSLGALNHAYLYSSAPLPLRMAPQHIQTFDWIQTNIQIRYRVGIPRNYSVSTFGRPWAGPWNVPLSRPWADLWNYSRCRPWADHWNYTLSRPSAAYWNYPSSGSRDLISLGSAEGCDLILLTQVIYHLNPGQNGCLLQAA